MRMRDTTTIWRTEMKLPSAAVTWTSLQQQHARLLLSDAASLLLATPKHQRTDLHQETLVGVLDALDMSELADYVPNRVTA